MIESENDVKWEGRTFVSKHSSTHQKPSVRCLSYHVLSENKCKKLPYTTSKDWDTRKVTLIDEIKSYDADIISLQDVDHFADWWRPKLMILGYDTIFKKRTALKESHDEGVLIGYKRNSFQLFKSTPVILNHAADDEGVTTFKFFLFKKINIYFRLSSS